MPTYDEDMIIAKRNIVALHESMKFFEVERSKNAKRVEDLMGTITQLKTEVQNLTIQVAVLRATSIGSGATNGN